MCAVVRLRALMARQAERLITNPPIEIKDRLKICSSESKGVPASSDTGPRRTWKIHAKKKKKKPVKIRLHLRRRQLQRVRAFNAVNLDLLWKLLNSQSCLLANRVTCGNQILSFKILNFEILFAWVHVQSLVF
jgi:hypothetical protein